MIRWIDVREFVEFGYLQEVNRNFFHPLGLALAVEVNADGTMSLAGIQDSRDDPEGIVFERTELDIAKSDRVFAEQMGRAVSRTEALGYVIQALEEAR